MDLLKLPEKSYFSHEELALRWQCEQSLIDHYINEGWLREAVDAKENYILKSLFDINNSKILEKLEQLNEYISIEKLGERLLENHKDIYDFISYIKPTRFVYILGKNHSLSQLPYNLSKDEVNPIFFCSTVFTSFSGDLIFSGKLNDKEITGDEKSQLNFESPILSYDDLVITREERDRFEKEYNLTIIKDAQEELVSTQGHNSYRRVFMTLAEALLGKNDFTAKELKDHVEKRFPGKRLPTEKTLKKYLEDK
ncbi:MAG: hypothetical protein ACJAW1_001498 [Glaciecola sp.]|jgi:hypothetical protein